MRLRAFPIFTARAALSVSAMLSAGLLATALLTPPATAKDEAPSDPCFDGKLSIKDVLDACQAFIDKGNDDKKLVIRAHSVRAMGLSATGNLDAAMDEIYTAVAIDPKRANSYFMRAAAYHAKKDYDKAVADLDTAIELKEDDPDFYLLRGLVYSQKNDYDAALTDLNKKVKLDPKTTNGYSNRGELYRKRKEFDSAVADYTKVIELDPESAKGYVDRGWIYVLQDNLDKAGPDFDTALEIQANNALALVGRGVVKSRTGDATDGSADLRMAERLEPGVFEQVRALGVK